jgi:hypothetical protein
MNLQRNQTNCALEYGVINENPCAFYREKANANPQNDQTMRKSPGYIVWVWALVLIFFKVVQN